jgi:hypothetical protein
LFEHDLFGKPVPTFPDHALIEERCSHCALGSASHSSVFIIHRSRDRTAAKIARIKKKIHGASVWILLIEK